MRIIEYQLRRAIRKTILTELEGKQADEWESAYREADKLIAQRQEAEPPPAEKQQDILDRINQGIDILIGPELRALDRFLTKLGI